MAVLGTNVKGGIRDLIEDGVNGILCNTDAESIRKGLARILKDRELSEKISKNARMDIVQNNSFEKVFFRRKIRFGETCWQCWFEKRTWSSN